VSVFPSGNHRVRFPVRAPGLAARRGVAGQRWFDGQLWPTEHHHLCSQFTAAVADPMVHALLVVHLDTLSLAGFAEIAALIVVILSVGLASYATAAACARRLFTLAWAVQRLSRRTGIVMAGAVVAVATR